MVRLPLLACLAGSLLLPGCASDDRYYANRTYLGAGASFGYPFGYYGAPYFGYPFQGYYGSPFLGAPYGEDGRVDTAVRESGYRLVFSNTKIQSIQGCRPRRQAPGG